MAKKATREATLRRSLETQVDTDFGDDSVVELDPRFEGLSSDIRERLQEAGGSLASLDPETRAALEEQHAARVAQHERGFGNRRDDLLNRLFSGGVERSNIAGEVGGQLIGDQEFVLQQEGASHATNVLQHRLGLQSSRLQGLAQESDLLSGERGAALADNAARIQQISDQRNRRAGFLSGIYDRENRVNVANIGANASIRSSQISADASRYGADRGLDAAHVSAGASMYGSDRALEGSLAHAAASRFGASMGANASIRSAEIHARTSRRNARLGFLSDQMRDSTNRYGIDATSQRFGDQLAFDQSRFATEDERARDFFDRDLGFRERDSRRSADIARQQARSQGRSSMLGGIGGLLGGLGAMGVMFSDERLKYDIQPIARPLQKLAKLRGVTWTWKESGEQSAGIIAQDLEKVMPEAVKEVDGYKVIDVSQVIGLLVAAINELAEEVW